MPQALVTLPDGKKAKVSFTDQKQLDSVVEDLTKEHATDELRLQKTRELEQQNPLNRVERRISEAVGEPALQIATGGLASMAGGVAGVARGLGAGAAALSQGEGLSGAGTAFTEEAADTIRSTQERFTRQPKTATGQRAAQIVGAPFTWLAGKADQAGEATAKVTGSPAAGAAVNTGIQSLPALLGRGIGAARGRIGRGPGASEPPLTATGAPRTPSPEPPGSPPGGAGPAAPPGGGPSPPLTATSVPRSPMASLPEDAGPPGPAATSPGPAPQNPPPGPAVQGGAPGGPVNPNSVRAQAYARSIGLDWARMGPGTRKALETIAQDATALDRLDPAAVERQAHLESQRIPVPHTRAQVTLDPVDARREAIAARTREGDRIRAVDEGANAAVQGNLEALRGRVGGLRGGLHEAVDPKTGAPAATPSLRAPTKTPTEVGSAKQSALREKAKWSKKGYQALYKIARETEPEAEVALKPVTDVLTSNPEIQHLGWVESWINRAGKVAKTAPGADPEGPVTHVTLNELHDLRSTANEIARTGGKEGYYAGQVVKAIDQAMQEAPEGAKAWKAANAAFKKHQQEFENQAAVKALISNKGGKMGTTPQVAPSKTWAKVATGDLSDLRQVKQSLLTGGTAATRMAGRRAWRDFRAETVNRILEDARNVTSTDAQERAILTAAALRRSINRIPRENLEEILGKANTRELMGILRSRELTRGRTTESGTVPNILVMAEKALGHIPVVGHAARAGIGAARGIQHLHELGKGLGAADEALTSPLQQAVEQAGRAPEARATRRAQQYRTIEGEGPTIGQVIPPGTAP